MPHVNVEIKARCSDLARVRAVLRAEGARRVGEDHQVDTYFRARRGRLKLRQGTIENALIFYDRPDRKGPKRSDVTLVPTEHGGALKAALTAANGVRTVVEKTREIYFVDNVKVHLDRVRGLGSFIEVEAIDEAGRLGEEHLQAQCEHFLSLFDVATDDLVEASYSDLLMARGSTSA